MKVKLFEGKPPDGVATISIREGQHLLIQEGKKMLVVDVTETPSLKPDLISVLASLVPMVLPLLTGKYIPTLPKDVTEQAVKSKSPPTVSEATAAVNAARRWRRDFSESIAEMISCDYESPREGFEDLIDRTGLSRKTIKKLLSGGYSYLSPVTLKGLAKIGELPSEHSLLRMHPSNKRRRAIISMAKSASR